MKMILDFLKTFCPCLIMHKYFGTEVGAISGFLTILGHIFPLFVNTNHSDTGFYSSSSHNKTNLELLKVDKPELQTKIFSSVKLKL